MPELDGALSQAIELVPDAKAELAAVDGANAQLVRLEDQAFALVREKQLPQAWALLNGDDYQRNKREYAEGMASFSNRLQQHAEAAIHAAHREAMWFLVAALGMGGIVALILLVGFYSLVRVLRARSAQ